MPDYRKPTEKETEKLNKARKMMTEGIEGEKDLFSKISTIAAKNARDDIRAARKLSESVPARAREGEAYEYAGYKKGGKVKAKRYNEGGMSLEEKYPEAKITRVPPNEPPSKSEKFKEIEADHKKSMPQTPGTRVTEPKFTDSGDTQDLKKVGRGRVSGGGGGAAPIPKAGRYEMLKFKKGGSISSASKRADGCAIRGKTKI